jgi:hypothetical protein
MEIQAPPLSTGPESCWQINDFEEIRMLCAPHKIFVDNATMTPIIELMVQCNNAESGAATVCIDLPNPYFHLRRFP